MNQANLGEGGGNYEFISLLQYSCIKKIIGFNACLMKNLIEETILRILFINLFSSIH